MATVSKFPRHVLQRLFNLLVQALGVAMYLSPTVLCLVLLMHPSLLVMLLVHRHQMLHQRTQAGLLTALVRQVSFATLVDSLVTTRMSALKIIMAMEFLHQRKLTSLLLLDVVD
jgi:hypothetical protein